MKFDVAVLNPPYERNLHFTFLKKAIESSFRYVLSIEPCNWLILPYKGNVSKNSDKGKCIQYVETYYSDIEVIQGMEYFDAYIAPKLSINLINKSVVSDLISVTIDGKKKTYRNVDDVLLYGNDSVIMSVREKLIRFIEGYENEDTLSDHIRINPHAKVGFNGKQDKIVREDDDTDKWWCVNLAIVRGNTSKVTGERGREFYTWLPDKRVPEPYNKDSKLCMVPFNSEEEAWNFIDYLKSDFARTIQYLVKTDYNQNQCMYRLPWLDFSKRWTDEELFKKFGISKEEAIHIRTLLPDYHARFTTGVTFETPDQDSMIEEEVNDERKNRRTDTGEVFTPRILVDKMLDKLPQYLFSRGYTFLDNSAGNGNFLVAVLERKLENGEDWQFALSEVYGTELMEDNVSECKKRLKGVVCHQEGYDEELADSILKTRIVNADSLEWDYEQWKRAD
ncbi:MAG: hypothetical protein J6Y37_00510 [Paludibacteraceae bacterium]|nr:hypothetical protein [Paludibacteraceae bacterium]